MAKRKRLAPAQGLETGLETGSVRAPEVKSLTGPAPGGDTPRPPIAHVAGDAASAAALAEVSQELRDAREGGRIVLDLPLDAIDAAYLVRDRLATDSDDLVQLANSIRGRGQQTPIEVTALGPGRYGLISGWRRLTALRHLAAGPDGAGFATIQALIRRPATAGDAYRSMVEENELRIGLSYYERARIVAIAVEQGVRDNDMDALRWLFASASRAKRSKIGSFLTLYHALDGRLSFAAAIPERLGLRLARAMDMDPGFGPRLADRLRKTPAGTAAAEIAVLEKALDENSEKQALSGQIDTVSAPRTGAAGGSGARQIGDVLVEARGRKLVLSGEGVDVAFRVRLEAWLRTAGKATAAPWTGQGSDAE